MYIHHETVYKLSLLESEVTQRHSVKELPDRRTITMSVTLLVFFSSTSSPSSSLLVYSVIIKWYLYV